jgi:hypothetical protein
VSYRADFVCKQRSFEQSVCTQGSDSVTYAFEIFRHGPPISGILRSRQQ